MQTTTNTLMAKSDYETRVKFRNYLKACRQVVIGRDKEITIAGAAILAKANFMLLGTPGEGKSFMSATLINNVKGVNTFFTQCSPETDMDAIFGTPIFQELQNGRMVRNVQGSLADCHFAFIDEIGKANDSLHKSMFTALNERVFVNGTAGTKKLDLMCAIAASNEALSMETAGLNSRFHLKAICKALDDDQRFELLSRRNDEIRFVFPDELKLDLETIQKAQADCKALRLSEDILRKIVALGRILEVSSEPDSRKLEICVDLVKASCWLRLKNDPESQDLLILKYALWDSPEHAKDVEQIVEDVVKA